VGELLTNLKELLLLDRGFGIEFSPRGLDVPAPSAQLPAPSSQFPAPSAQPPVPGPQPPAPSPQPAPRPAFAVCGTPAADLATIAAAVAGCRACKLCQGRTNTVPGEGAPAPALVFVGEGPGADEDAQGRPFVGPAGQLLTKMIQAMGFRREEVYICNVVKCRPPGNRNPEPDEVAACLPFLEAQLAALKPQVICTLGNVPLKALLGPETPGITRMRGQRLDWRGNLLIPTFHPSYLLRNPEAKKPAWEDLKQVLAALGRTPPAR
jgi:DNA polymerase